MCASVFIHFKGMGVKIRNYSCKCYVRCSEMLLEIGDIVLESDRRGPNVSTKQFS